MAARVRKFAEMQRKFDERFPELAGMPPHELALRLLQLDRAPDHNVEGLCGQVVLVLDLLPLRESPARCERSGVNGQV